MAAPKVSLRLVGKQAGPLKRTQRDYVEQLYSQHRADVYRYISRILPAGAGDPESVLQDTYMRLLKQSSLDKLADNARAYIFTTATNLVRDALRRHGRRKGAWHEPLHDDEHYSDEQTPYQEAQWQQSLMRLRQALAQLKPVTQQVFTLSRLHGYSYPEIATEMSLSTRSIERHMSKAMAHLQYTLDDLI